MTHPVPAWQDDMKKRLKELTDGPRFKPQEGTTIIRALPGSLDGNAPPCIEYLMHYRVGPGKRTVRCGKNVHGEGSCWLCDKALPALAATQRPEYVAMAEEMRYKDVFALQVAYFDREQKRWIGPKIWEASGGVAKTLYAYFTSQDQRIDDVNVGHNMRITRTGQGLGTRYPALTLDSTPSKAPASVLARFKPLASLTPVYSEKEQIMAYKGERTEAPPTPEALAAQQGARPAPVRTAAPGPRAGVATGVAPRRPAPQLVDELPADDDGLLPEELPEDELAVEELAVEELPADEVEADGDELPTSADDDGLLPVDGLDAEGDELAADGSAEDVVEELPELPDDFEPEPDPVQAPAARRAAATAAPPAPKKTAAAPPRRPVAASAPKKPAARAAAPPPPARRK